VTSATVRTLSDTRPLIAGRKYALVVSPHPKALESLVMRLRANGFRVALAHSLEDTLTIIERMPWLSLLVVDGSAVDRSPPLAIRRVRDKHPELPVLWVTPDEVPDVDLVPDMMVASSREKDVIQKTEGLLGRRYYPAFIVEGLTTCTTDALQEAFSTDAELLSVSLKLTRTPLGNIIPILAFAGRDLSGHLVLNASESEFRMLRRKVVRTPVEESADLGDLGGEMLNQILGRLKAHCLRYGITIELGLPMVVTGEKVTLRFPRAAPGIVFDFYALGRHLYVEFSVTSMDVSADPTATEIDGLRAGELSFL